MTSTATPLDHAPSQAPAPGALPRLYLIRALAALLWAGILLVAQPGQGVLLTVLLVAYPLLDAVAVAQQLRAPLRGSGTGLSEKVNIAVSAVVAVALGVASTLSIPAVLVIWGLWAIGSGLPQLLTAIRRRRAGGQVPQMLSGGISVLAGASFAAQGVSGGEMLSGIGGYAVLGAVFFLVSALRLALLARRSGGSIRTGL